LGVGIETECTREQHGNLRLRAKPEKK
jgi:hypothetical protein